MREFILGHSYLISQIFGFSAMATGIILYQFKKHRTVMLLMVLNASLWCCSYFFLQPEDILWAPILLNLINVLRSFTLSFRDKKWCRHPAILVAFIVLSIAVSVATWDGPDTLLPVVATVFATVASWMTDPKKLRYLTYPVCIGWFVYNALHGSVSAMCNETFVFISVTVALIRFRRAEKAAAQDGSQSLPLS